VAAEELMTIGRFARISGLSVHTLRHYDDIGLLAPAQTHPLTGSRRYRRDQVRQARLIQALRWIDLPIEEIRVALAGMRASSSILASAPRRSRVPDLQRARSLRSLWMSQARR